MRNQTLGLVVRNQRNGHNGPLSLSGPAVTIGAEVTKGLQQKPANESGSRCPRRTPTQVAVVPHPRPTWWLGNRSAQEEGSSDVWKASKA